ncbi:MAG: helical backbone metal receptor [Methanomassiliicoccaceae archaeon]|nr:helical backbone metal receptor [Methanomassiliicoccaceae archaeon]
MNRTKVYASIAIVVFATMATALVGGSTYAFTDSGNGIIIDFGDRDAVWTSLDVKEYPDAASALGYACSPPVHGFELKLLDGAVSSIKGLPTPPSKSTWSLWVVQKGGLKWNTVDSDPTSVMVSEYSAVAWALCAPGEGPSVQGVDQTGVNYWSYKSANKVVTLSPSVTETVCAIGGSNTIIGVDEYSNYPDSVAKGKASGRIKTTGGYTNPNFETILKLDPDIVICDGSQASHRIVAAKLRNVGVNAVVLYAGEALETLYDNIYITGTAVGFYEGKSSVINNIKKGIDQVVSDICIPGLAGQNLLFSLSAVKSPWVAGGDTYINDISETLFGVNVFNGLKGWTMVNSEMIVKASPEVIIVVSEGSNATEADYLRLIGQISEGWEYIDAEIYMICGSAADLVSRPGPRLAQVTELFAMILYDPAGLPYYIGSEYTSYLTITKTLGFNL